MRDTLYNAIALIAIMAFAAFIAYASVTIVLNMHPAEACMEDEVWAPVHYQTQGADRDAGGVTRMCVNIDELKQEG